MRLDSDWTLLHPFSPFLRAGRFAVIAVIFLAQQGAALSEPGFAALGLLLVILVAGGFGWMSWRMMGYRLDGNHLELRSGLLRKEHRRLPLARIEAVDVAQPVLPRLLGLSEVRVQSASSEDSELRLQYLAESTAWEFRDRLRVAGALAQAPLASTSAEDPAADVTHGMATDVDQPSGRVLFEVSNTELLYGYLLSRVVVPVVLASVALTVGVAIGEVAALGGAVPFLIIIFGTVASGLRTVEGMYGFTLFEHPDGLFIHRGLLNKLTQRVALDRVQSVALHEPWLWRRFGRSRLLVDVAGYRSHDAGQGEQVSLLIPIAPRSECQRVLQDVLPLLGYENIEVNKAPRQARWLEPIGAPRLKLGVNQRCAVSVHGVLRRYTVVVPHRKVQSWRLEAGPLQRRLGLATLYLDTAGGHLGFTARLRGRSEAEEVLNHSRVHAR